MTIHKEGRASIIITFVVLAIVNIVALYVALHIVVCIVLLIAALLLWGFIIRFFRMPSRPKINDEHVAFSPCDGRVVIIDEVFEPEFLKENCRQVSIFMSPNNVHVNMYPVSGRVEYYRYHAGKYLVAWHPKSSLLNERTTVALNTGKHRILCRQVAGAVARRVVCYAKEGQHVEQNTQLGFIKFGSRVDLYLPLSAKVEVMMGQRVRWGSSVIATL
jgi:phosphatidylserine decarboxylase